MAPLAAKGRDSRLRPWARAAIVVASVLVAAAPRMIGETWVQRARPGLVVELEGRAVEWEWIDVRQSMQVAEGDQRWAERGSVLGEGALLSQNASRFLPGVVLTLLRPWTGGLVAAANLATVGLWALATLGTAGLCARMTAGTRWSGSPAAGRAPLIAGALTVVSPGFGAFAGNIDAHQFGYAAAPLGLLLLDRAWTAPVAPVATRAVVAHSTAGAVLARSLLTAARQSAGRRANVEDQPDPSDGYLFDAPAAPTR